MSLAAYLDTKKGSPKRLLGHVERHILTRPPEERSTLVLHPSEIIKPDWCLRASYFLLEGIKGKEERNVLRRQNIFDEGHEYHRKWQQRFEDMGVLYGLWSVSPKGRKKVWGVSRDMPYGARYLEVPLFDPELRIGGKADGWIKGIGDDCLIEIKSIGEGTIRMATNLLTDFTAEEAWKRIDRPFGDHMRQGQVYLELARRQYGEEAPKEIVFLYEWKANQDVKEFTVRRNFEFVADAFDEAMDLRDYLTNRQIPPCSITRSTHTGCHKCDQFGGFDAA